MKRSLKLVGVLALAVVLFGLLPATAVAGGKALGHGGRTPATSATIGAVPDPSAPYTYIRVQGCGYYNDRTVEVHIEHVGYTEAYAAWVWASGCIDFGLWTAEPGTYTLKAYQTVKRSKVLMATSTMQVE